MIKKQYWCNHIERTDNYRQIKIADKKILHPLQRIIWVQRLLKDGESATSRDQTIFCDTISWKRRDAYETAGSSSQIFEDARARRRSIVCSCPAHEIPHIYLRIRIVNVNCIRGDPLGGVGANQRGSMHL